MKNDHVAEYLNSALKKRLTGSEPPEVLLDVVKTGEFVFRDQIGDFITYKRQHPDDPVELT